MIFLNKSGCTASESYTLPIVNPIVSNECSFEEAMISDFKASEIRTIYPLMTAMHSNRLTKNYTLYPKESLIGNKASYDCTGYASFVTPFGKPVITAHNLEGSFLTPPDVPMGRIIASNYTKNKGTVTPHPKKGFPGSLEGDGSMNFICAITEPDAIRRVLGKTFSTVSIQTKADKVIESISGLDLIKCIREGKEFPPYERGQLYNGMLSYLSMHELKGKEVSFVNSPSDELAGVAVPDVGLEGIKMFVSQRKLGKNNEYELFDAKSGIKYEWEKEFTSIDSTFFSESFEIPSNNWWIKPGKEATWGNNKRGIITEILDKPQADFPSANFHNPICKISVTKNGNPANTYVFQPLSVLEEVANNYE